MLRRLFILFIAAWLPLQGASALAMPYGGAGAASEGEHVAQSDASDVHRHEGHSHHGGQGGPHASSVDSAETGMAHDDHATSSVGCERCGLCQFVHGGVMINSAAGLPAMPAPQVYSAPSDERFSVYFPEQPQRPPLSAV